MALSTVDQLNDFVLGAGLGAGGRPADDRRLKTSEDRPDTLRPLLRRRRLLLDDLEVGLDVLSVLVR
jgi:hypothetical protein